MAKIKREGLKSRKYILILEDGSNLVIKRGSIKDSIWEFETSELKKDDVKMVDKILSIQPESFNNLCKQIQKSFKQKIINIL